MESMSVVRRESVFAKKQRCEIPPRGPGKRQSGRTLTRVLPFLAEELLIIDL
jgi:hypothetical protein